MVEDFSRLPNMVCLVALASLEGLRTRSLAEADFHAADIAPHGFSIMTEHKPVVGVAC